VKPLVQTRFNELNGVVSLNGRWLAYQSDDSGRNEIFDRPLLREAGGLHQLSTGGGTRPLWPRDGGELFCLTPQRALMSVPIGRGDAWASGAPVKLFEGPYYAPVSGALGRTYDVSPDGQRFLMIEVGADTAGALGGRGAELLRRAHAPRANGLETFDVAVARPVDRSLRAKATRRGCPERRLPRAARPRRAHGLDARELHRRGRSTQEQTQFEATRRERRRFKTLAEFSAATKQDIHNMLVDDSVFVNVTPAGSRPAHAVLPVGSRLPPA
jgi:hypothetical protein